MKRRGVKIGGADQPKVVPHLSEKLQIFFLGRKDFQLQKTHHFTGSTKW